MWYVYCTTNLVNGRLYIGKHKGSVDDQYLGSGRILHRAINKYGRENFVKSILEVADTEAEIDLLEIKWISHYRSINEALLYNLTDGGTGGNTTKYLDPAIVSQSRSGWSVKMAPGELQSLKLRRREQMIERRKDGALEAKRIQNLKKTIKSKSRSQIDEEYKKRSGELHYKSKAVITPLGKFGSCNAAAQAHNVNAQTIVNRCRNPNFEGWKFDEDSTRPK